MTIHLPEDIAHSIEAAVQGGDFASAEDALAEAWRTFQRQRQQSADAQPTRVQPDPPERKPLWERAAELRQSIPPEEWDKVPTDGARQLDHYIYGSPRRADA